MPDTKPHAAAGSATTKQKAEFIEQSRWGRDLQWEQTQKLAFYFDHREAPAGTVLFQEGSSDASLWLVVRGEVEVLKADAEGNTKSIARIGAGRTFGELALIDGQPRSATVRTVAGSALLVMTPAHFARLKEEVPKLALSVVLKIALAISANLRQTSGRLVEAMESSG